MPGLVSAGLASAGLVSAGLVSTGMFAAGFATSGVSSLGAPRVGISGLLTVGGCSTFYSSFFGSGGFGFPNKPVYGSGFFPNNPPDIGVLPNNPFGFSADLDTVDVAVC